MNRASLVHRAVAAREDVRDDGVFSIATISVDVRVVGFALHFVTYFSCMCEIHAKRASTYDATICIHFNLKF